MKPELYKELFKLGARNIKRRGKRTWLTVIGVVIGVAAIIALVSLGQGLEASIVEEFESLGANNLYISPDGGELTESDLDIIERVIGVEEATGLYQTTGEVTYRGEAQEVSITGFDPGDADIVFGGLGLELDEGRQLRQTDLRNSLIGARVKDDTFERDVGIGSQLDIKDERVTVVGSLAEAGEPEFERSVMLPIDTVRSVFDVGDDQFNNVIVRTQPGFEPDDVKDSIEEELRRDRGLEEGEEDFEIQTAQDILDSLTNILSVVQGIVIGIASIALLVGGIGIMNTMYMSITERTREIGVMKAIGARKKHITSVFLFEAGIIGVVGSLIGLLAGLGISNAAIFGINEFTDFRAIQVYSPELIFGAILFGFVLGIVSGILPSRKAAKMDPAESLRYE